MSFQLTPFGDSAVLLHFGDIIDERIHEQVRLCTDILGQKPFPGMIECVPAYASVTVHYELLEVKKFCGGQPAYLYIEAYLRGLFTQLTDMSSAKPRTIILPVCYGGEYGPDLSEVARYTNMTEQEVISLHSGGTYKVYMIGFAPGFPYLGGMPGALFTPRKQVPRVLIPAGSVGIAGEQTGVYSLPTPGGWQIIGRTPRRLFEPDAKEPVLLRAGDIVRFQPISLEEFQS
nr:5-oxoprolinase subunit PxpB [Paenibacillus sp. Marseille-Q4541]